jgi:hypothetical protein
MRSLVLAGLTAASCVGAFGSPSHGQITISPPSVVVGDPYWRQHHDDAQWRRQDEWRETQYQRHEWQRDHCVRDWDGHGYCR